MDSHDVTSESTLLRSKGAAKNEARCETDSFAATYKSRRGRIARPTEDIREFLETELIPSKLETFKEHMWAIGARRAAAPLNHQVAFGREIVAWENINLHLVWNGGGKIFIKPLPRFLLDNEVWKKYFGGPLLPTCNPGREPASAGDTPSAVQVSPGQGGNQGKQISGSSSALSVECMEKLRSCALGFVYTYICLISHESDFAIAKEKHLLPLANPSHGPEIQWDNWKEFSLRVLSEYDVKKVHWRFQRGELRLSRLNFFSRFTQFPPFTSYVRGWRTYGSLVRDNVTWLATAAVFVALVLTALQVGLATDQLKNNGAFVRFSYGFSVFSIVAPVGAFAFIIVEAVYNVIKDNVRPRSTQSLNQVPDA
ncbi:hypothetical protein F4680DRAFT_420035 [Xylaria scruposa]|nr:hypothetical protein F4680DRAFT_420035 [Xylaria scruposa]